MPTLLSGRAARHCKSRPIFCYNQDTNKPSHVRMLSPVSCRGGWSPALSWRRSGSARRDAGKCCGGEGSKARPCLEKNAGQRPRNTRTIRLRIDVYNMLMVDGICFEAAAAHDERRMRRRVPVMMVLNEGCGSWGSAYWKSVHSSFKTAALVAFLSPFLE